MMNEFSVIQHFFAAKTFARSDVFLGIGDDAAIITPPANHQIIITTDTLVSNVHFSTHTSAYDVGFKSLAVNLSDLAAMGATPAWLTLALTLPVIDETWLAEFSRGFFALATEYETQLVGGDLTQGPLSITIQAHGLVPFGEAIQRNNAKPGDLIYVTNQLGDAALALAISQDKIHLPEKYHASLFTKLNHPTPQIKIGEELRGVASAAIDISDGLAADLGHILEKSGVGAEVNVDRIPLSSPLKNYLHQADALPFALSGGDDYELCFTLPIEKKHRVPKNCTCIGVITDTKKLALRFSDGTNYSLPQQGYQHFK